MNVWVVIVEYEVSYYKTLGVFASEERAIACMKEWLGRFKPGRYSEQDFLIEVHKLGKE